MSGSAPLAFKNMEVDKVCIACFERLKKSKSQKLRYITGNHGTFQDMKTSPIFSNSSEPEAGILQEIQPQVKVLGATVGSSLDSRILKFKHLNWSWKGREPFFICNNASQVCWLFCLYYIVTLKPTCSGEMSSSGVSLTRDISPGDCRSKKPRH